MGLYDVVVVPCPNCGERHDFQSKGGERVLRLYELNEAPDDVMSDINRHAPTKCINCGTYFHVDIENKDILFSTKEEVKEKEDRHKETVDRLIKLVNLVKDPTKENNES